jgi:hypothetical protein
LTYFCCIGPGINPGAALGHAGGRSDGLENRRHPRPIPRRQRRDRWIAGACLPPSGSAIAMRASSARMRGSRPSSWRAIYCNPGLLATLGVLSPVGDGNAQQIILRQCALIFAVQSSSTPLVLGGMAKRGAQPGAGTSLAGLNNSCCDSLIGCYGISGRPFIVSRNLSARIS